jgi:hypothetical protein
MTAGERRLVTGRSLLLFALEDVSSPLVHIFLTGRASDKCLQRPSLTWRLHAVTPPVMVGPVRRPPHKYCPW